MTSLNPPSIRPRHRRLGSARAPLALLLALPAALFLAGCAEEPATSPGATHSLSGRVRLVGHLVDTSGTFAGTRVVDDADGVHVELLFGPSVVAQTNTVDGVYTFSGLGPGAYHARASVIGPVADETGNLTITGSDIVAGHVLTLESQGDLLPIPNPRVDTVRVWFDNPDNQYVEMRVRDLQGTTTRVLVASPVQSGLKVVLWTGIDQVGAPVTAPYYWVTFEAGADKRAHLLFQ